MGEFSLGAIAAAMGRAIEPTKPAIMCGDDVTTWGEFDRRTNALAAAFAEAGAVPGDKVAHLMRNSPAYLETNWAAWKARLVHVNVNYRYTGEELLYIIDNSDAAVVVYDAEFRDVMEGIRNRLPGVKLWLQVGGDAPEFAGDFEAAASADVALHRDDHRPDDMLFIYTGGTTGYPKGVMWDQGDMWALIGGGAREVGREPSADLEDHLIRIRETQANPELEHRSLILPPLMHGTGYLSAINPLLNGGSVVLSALPVFDPADAIRLTEKWRPNRAIIVGDAFARPLVDELDAHGGDISSLKFMVSSGTMWSPEVKAGLLRHNEDIMLMDSLGSSESVGIGLSVTAKDNVGTPTVFARDENTIVVDEDMKPIPPGDERVGRIARGGLIPRGYYKDEKKTAETFLTIDGQRYSLAGDHAKVEADGSFTLMGRGNQCINSGGEKIYPEEVEEALKTHPAITDALVFGLPDEQWGSAVTAVAHAKTPVDVDDLIAHVKTRLAAFKAPKRVKLVDEVPRAPNGKADYAAARAFFGQ